MAKERAGLDVPDLTSFTPRQQTTAEMPSSTEVKKVAETAGFPTRHASSEAPVINQPFDARSLRKTNKTAKLNIAVSSESRERFWRLAVEAGIDNGEDALVAMMNAFEREE